MLNKEGLIIIDCALLIGRQISRQTNGAGKPYLLIRTPFLRAETGSPAAAVARDERGKESRKYENDREVRCEKTCCDGLRGKLIELRREH